MMTKERGLKSPVEEPRREPTVVIVDDQPEVLVSLRRALRDEHFELATFSSPIEALEWTRNHPVDLVIADERMPDMRGSDLLEQIRDRSPNTIRVILTGYPGSATVGYGLAHGVDWLISKPWNDEALKITLRQLLDEHDPDAAPQVPASGPPDLAEFCDRAPIAMACFDPGGAALWANRAALELLGQTRDGLSRCSLSELFADPGEMRELVQKIVKNEAVRRHSVRLRRKDGIIVDAELDAEGHRVNGRLVHVRAAIRGLAPSTEPHRSEESLEQELRERTHELEVSNNELLKEIAEHNRAEETRRLTEMRFRLLVEGVKDYSILMLAPDGIVVSWNDGAERISGYTAEDILGRHFSLFYVTEDIVAGKPERLLQTAGKQERVEDEGWRRRKDGSKVWSNEIISAVRDTDGRLIGFSKVTRDMSERRRADEERSRLQASMLQGQKLQAIGQLSAGIAHEINNPVGYILSNLNTMGEYCTDLRKLAAAGAEAAKAWQDKRDPSAALEEYVRISTEIHADHVLSDLMDIVSDCKLGGEKIRDIVRSLREFSHVDPSELLPTDLNKVLEDSLRICWNELKYKATLKKEFGTLPAVPVYAQRLSQVFVNLLVNAAQAIDKRGEILLKTYVENEEAVVKIRDTGKGIAPEHLPKIFEPFFTTKEIGAGTGLGLHVAYKIITAHRGKIEVASEIGRGTEFTVRLPLQGAAPRKEA
jgi:PAS domain S-box-containing protein